MARGRPWSAEDSARLRQLVQACMIDVEIACALGRARETITRKRKLLGLAPGGSPENRAALLAIAARRATDQMTEDANMPERPTTYTPELGRELCRRLSDGSPLGRILRDPAMPARDTVQRWQRERPEFAAGYAGARENLVEALAEDALERAGDATAAPEVATCRVFLSAVRLYAGLLSPRRARAARPGGASEAEFVALSLAKDLMPFPKSPGIGSLQPEQPYR